ncbi:profilin-1-like protein [Leptotrombidium deliense]|uniref:Profilin n=1 Tax=Leptotrombidium deliense TaxID=299467 RepID=A0A443S847_9ACAR|nr:profilin-1-like protein [Leptotrombidium deliense]
MNWKEFADVVCENIKCRQVVIAGIDGSMLATNSGDGSISMTAEELKQIADTMRSNPSSFQDTGIQLGGESFDCRVAESNMVNGVQDGCTVCVRKTKQCLVAAISKRGVPHMKLVESVEQTADFLASNGY